VIGCNILPARVLRPTDKAACERAFGVIRQRLFELLVGYTGVDVADRGADPAADATLTVEELEHLIATWIVSVWQQRALGQFSDRQVPFDASELVFRVADMSVTLTALPGGSADEWFGPGGLSCFAPQRQVSEYLAGWLCLS
jgi:hypothetical protein